MPQFDKITFLNQIFWLFLSFFFIYFLILKNFLPELAFSLKLREKVLLKNNKNAAQNTLEILENFQSIQFKTLNIYYFLKSKNNNYLISCKKWLIQNLQVTNFLLRNYENTIFKKYNNIYILSFIQDLVEKNKFLNDFQFLKQKNTLLKFQINQVLKALIASKKFYKLINLNLKNTIKKKKKK
jgi:hypothetical protein